ncbi:PREDICTED: uncharacterized protein LOC108764448 [Trachymyrmex cornetzi]|uniref:uncharacterized protein LOC108764448 n=1 Tax=Trachymyrmex cornetzi TaxID=471704 RepID=UPI00084F30E7|nr:PREDICTED: uncharacterized protein LOC108764448 [Trachymyrmex cornetzi]
MKRESDKNKTGLLFLPRTKESVAKKRGRRIYDCFEDLQRFGPTEWNRATFVHRSIPATVFLPSRNRVGNVSKTIGGPQIIVRANQSRIEFRNSSLYVEPSGRERGTCEKEKRDRRGTK